MLFRPDRSTVSGMEYIVSFERLCIDHMEIDRVAEALIEIVLSPRPDPDAATSLLERLAAMVRDHLAAEDPVIYTTVALAAGGRHADVAADSVEMFEQLKEDWGQYLYLWDRARVAADWPGFATHTREMLVRLRARLLWESTVLYAMAVHHGVIDGIDPEGIDAQGG